MADDFQWLNVEPMICWKKYSKLRGRLATLKSRFKNNKTNLENLINNINADHGIALDDVKNLDYDS